MWVLFLYPMKLTIIIPVYNQEELILRALDSIPVRDDIEVIVIDDGCTDHTWMRLRQYQERSALNLCLLYNETNQGVAVAVNKGLDNASGEYVVLLGSDDYFLQNALNEAIDTELNGADLVYFDLEVNNGTIFSLTPVSKNGYCGSVKFMRREFIGDLRNDETKRQGEDYYFNIELQKKKPTEVFTGKVLKHYNYPRQGSLTWKATH